MCSDIKHKRDANGRVGSWKSDPEDPFTPKPQKVLTHSSVHLGRVSTATMKLSYLRLSAVSSSDAVSALGERGASITEPTLFPVVRHSKGCAKQPAVLPFLPGKPRNDLRLFSAERLSCLRLRAMSAHPEGNYVLVTTPHQQVRGTRCAYSCIPVHSAPAEAVRANRPHRNSPRAIGACRLY